MLSQHNNHRCSPKRLEFWDSGRQTFAVIGGNNSAYIMLLAPHREPDNGPRHHLNRPPTSPFDATRTSSSAPLTDQIRAKLSEPAGRDALKGLGGVGQGVRSGNPLTPALTRVKEVTARDRVCAPATAAVTAYMGAVGPCEQCGALRAERSERSGPAKNLWQEASKRRLLRLLRNRLRDESKGKWLIVLDNADDVVFVLEPPATTGEAQPAHRWIDYISTCDHGPVIITTRSKGEALKLVYESEMVDVLPMGEGEAETLLESKLGRSSQGTRELVLALDCMPLSISQAAAYIRERTPLCSVQQYREEMEQSRAAWTSLLRRDVPLPSGDAEASSSVLLTWQISSDHIYATRKSAAELLSLMSFCD
ncbi:hypothetical protein LTR56_025695 [Elasticomyces elasticus]|nr:hypothetical protein LTR56_025695 [Elasticomyces elasticus]KAK3622371.1 hypothetical protein LTR22_024825 [Elasticomyces elasticus]KAK4901450.1 hypothetical protein LTR49_027246 [Elasticomyces elasticus]